MDQTWRTQRCEPGSCVLQKLDEFGVPHEAEEYRGVWGERNRGQDGRIYTEVLPFFRKHLVFADTRSTSSLC